MLRPADQHCRATVKSASAMMAHDFAVDDTMDHRRFGEEMCISVAAEAAAGRVSLHVDDESDA